MNRIRTIISVFLLISCFQAGVFAASDDIIIKEIEGFVQIQRLSESDWVKAEENAVLGSGDRVRSLLKSSALLVFPDASEFRLRENTSVDIKDISENLKDNTAKRELKLNLGSLHYKIPPKKEKATKFKIHSSTSIVGITGTEGVMTAKGDGKPSENILIEGATYNTDDQGQNGTYQTKGNIYSNDGKSSEVFSAEVSQEALDRMTISEESIQLINDVVALYKQKKDEGYGVAVVEIVIKQAFFYLEKRNYDLVKQMVQRVEKLLETVKKVEAPTNIEKSVSNIYEQIKVKESEGYDTFKLYASFANVQSLMQSGYFKEAIQEVTSLQQKLALLTKTDEQLDFETHFQDIQLRVLEKEKQGFVLGEIKSMLRQSRLYYDQDDKPMAYQFLNNAQDRITHVLKNVSDNFAKNMDRLQGEIALKKADAYPTKELELRLDEARVFIKEEDFLKARELVTEIEKRLLTLSKAIPVEWQLKISEMKRDISYKEVMGYDLNYINGEFGKLEDYQSSGDLVSLEPVFESIKNALSNLKIPTGFEANWNEFLKEKAAKEVLNYELREINILNEKIQGAVDKGDITSARSFLKKAQELLVALKDEEPPNVQVLSYEEQSDFIKIEGFVDDNTKIKNVSVNHSDVSVSEDGKFSFTTVPTQSLTELSIRAQDVGGNMSAPVVIKVEGQYKTDAVKGKLKATKIEYSKDGFTVKGRYVPGGGLKVGDIRTISDKKGNFSVTFDPRKLKITDSIIVSSLNSGGSDSNEITLSIEDQWAPKIKIEKIEFNDSLVPTLEINPLDYSQSKVSVSGQVSVTQMANIKGSVFDLGGQVASLKIADSDVDIREDGTFTASLVIDPSGEQLIAKAIALDKSGNTASRDVALDAVWNLPHLTINSQKTALDSSGAFQRELLVTKEVEDIVIVLQDDQGQTISSKRVLIADILPPELEIQDVRYEGKNVLIFGTATPNATVYEKDKSLFIDPIKVSQDTSFVLTAKYPSIEQEIIIIASNIEGKTSDEVHLTVGPPKDNKAPKLYVSYPQFNNKKIVVEGFIEDDSDIRSLTVQGTPVTINNLGRFSHEMKATPDLTSIKIIATDVFDAVTIEVIALKDKEPPKIVIDTWEAKEGRLIIAGQVNDNVGVKEVRLNDMPIALGNDAQLKFSYDGVLTEDSEQAVIVAVDLLNNEAREGPRKLEIPTDTTIPTGKSIGMKYGSPIIYTSGEVIDPTGIKAVYVNGEKVELFDNGTFNIKVNIDVGPPKLELESPAYDNGKVTVAGKVAPGDFSPSKITVESEDLSGNRGVLFSQDVAPYLINELEVIVNGHVVDVDEQGSFSYQQPINLGERTIDVEALDPFDNGLSLNLDLESNEPIIELNPLEYNTADQLVTLSGQARDEDSGLSTVMVNGVRIDFGSDGSFTQRVGFSQGSLSVVATDFIGNSASLSKEVKPPDVWPPVFSINVSPVPSIIGNPVHIEITALDSNSRLPEILAGPPTVSVNVDGVDTVLPVEGEGANYIATFETTGLNPVLVAISVQGGDQSGNNSSDLEGMDTFVLVADDTIIPSFTIEANPSPIVLGEESSIKVFASEDLQTAPTLEATLPSGTVVALDLTSAGVGEYESSVTVLAEEGIGSVLLKLTGGEDLSGNVHDTTEVSVDVAAPVTVSDLLLNILTIEFLPDRFTITGQTASEAIVRIDVGEFGQDSVADIEGLFIFERPVSFSELEQMHSVTDSIRVSLRAHNYAGFESQTQFFEVPLPPLPVQGGTNFDIQLQPSPVGQGDILNINIDVLSAVTGQPRGFLYLPDGSREFVDLQGQDRLTGQYNIPEDAALGSAMFEVVTDTTRESSNFDIVLSTEWMQRLNKYDFFRIHVSSDPLIIGEETQFFVDTLGDLDTPPELQIMLPGGRTDSIPLQGGPRNFQGNYTSPNDVVPGGAELVLNAGTPDEIRRPFGVEEPFSEGAELDVYLLANPTPLLGGEPYYVNLSFSQDVPFRPQLILKLQDGRRIEMPLSGDIPSNNFTAQGSLPDDVGSGLAQFVLLDDQGLVIDRFPAQVTGPIITTAGLDIFVVPDVLHRLDRATIQLNSVSSLSGRIEAHVGFADGSKMVVFLEGGETIRNGEFVVPDHVPEGMVTITVFAEDGQSLGSTRAQVVEHGDMGGPINIFIDNPDFNPSDRVRFGVESGWPLSFIPRAQLIWDGGSLSIPLVGRIPGNRFGGEFTAPPDPIENARIEVNDREGAILGEFVIADRPEGDGDVIVTPMPPVIGEPLSIRVVAPTAVDSAPTMRLVFSEGGSRELNAYGAIPGDTFVASLDRLENPLQFIEIIHDGQVVANIPVGHLAHAPPEFTVDTFEDLVPCEMANLVVRANNFVPFVPYLNIDFQGRTVDVPLGQMSPTEFIGRLNVPCDASVDHVGMQLYDPQGRLLWQRTLSQGGDTGVLNLNVMPVDDNGIELFWDMLRGVEEYEIRYGLTAAFGETATVSGVADYFLTGLTPGSIYFFQVAAFKDGRELMFSNTVSATVGNTTRELHVQEQIDGNIVNLFWTDYPGADGFRVVWGNASGSYPNSEDLQTNSFAVPGLVMGNIYFMKVLALEAGQVIGESREVFILLQAFQSQGGDIYLTPDPPVEGQDLQISMHFFDDLPFIPNVVVHLQNGDVPLVPTGFGRDYMAILSADAFTSSILAIDVYGPDGQHLVGRGMSGPGGGGANVPLFITPDPPQIGYDLNIRAEFPGPAGFMPALFVEFASETRQYAFPQLANNSTFETTISGGTITSSVIRIWIEDPNGQFLSGWDSSGGPGPGGGPNPPNVYPDPPIFGQPLNIEIDVDEIVNQPPLLRIHFTDQSPQEVSMIGTTPGQFFTYSIPALTSMVTSIEFINPVTLGTEHTWYPGTAGPQSCDIIILSEDPPIFGQPIDLRVVFPEQLAFTPTLFVDYENGPRTYLFPQAPGLYVYEMALPIAEMNSQVLYLKILDDNGDPMCDRGPFGGGAFQVTTLTVNPDPPVINTNLQIHVEFNTPVPFTPRWRLFSISGPIEGDFTQGPGLSVYDQTVPASLITLYPTDLEILDDNNNALPGGELFFVGPENFTCTVDFDPFPPQAFTNLTVTVNYEAGNFPAYVPTASMEFEGGGGYQQQFTQPAGVGFYQMTIAAASITDTIILFGVGDSSTGGIDCGADFEEGFNGVDITLDVDPPQIDTPLVVTATFDHPVPFVPKLVIEYYGAPDKTFTFNGGPGQTVYQFTTVIGDMGDPVKRIAVETPQGEWIPDDLFFPPPAALDYPHNLFTQTTGVSGEIKIFWDVVSGAAGYKVYYGTGSQNYNDSNSPEDITDPNTTQYVVDGLNDNTLYFLTVEAYDAQNNESNNPEEVSRFPGTGGGALVSAPAIISRSASAGNSIAQQTLTLTNNGAAAANVRFLTFPLNKEGGGGNIPVGNYTITPAGATNIAASGNANFNVNLDIPAGAAAGNYGGDIKFYDDVNNNSAFDTGESFVEVDVGVTVTGGGSGFSSDPVSINKNASQGGSISPEAVSITNNSGANVKVRIEDAVLLRDGGGGSIAASNYDNSPAFVVINDGSSGGFTVRLDIPGAAADGDYSGPLKFYGDTNDDGDRDAGEEFVEVIVSVSVSAFDHIRITSNTNSSTMGSPIFVTLTAEDSGNNKLTSFQTDVDIQAVELDLGEIPGSWHLSMNDGPQGPDSNSVAMFDGQGGFTVDSLEPGFLDIHVISHTSVGGPLNLEFTPQAGLSAATGYAIIGPNRAPTSTSVGAPFWIAAFDATGQVKTNYTGTVDFSLGGSAKFVSNSQSTLSHTFAAADNGQFMVEVRDNTTETVSLTATENPGSLVESVNIDFSGVSKYLVYAGSSDNTTFTTQGSMINFTLRAADSSDNIIRSYNKTATFTRISDPTSDAFLSDGTAIQFVDGVAEIVLNNNQAPEAVTWKVEEDTTPTNATGTITTNFQSSDSTAPEIVSVEMDTPWIVHIYFNEDIDSVTGGDENNYDVGGGFGSTIDKVCWYGDNVTLNLSTKPASLGGSFNLAIKLVKDTTGNAIADDPGISYNSISVPDVDFQGAAGATNDWFEIQASNTNPAAGETIHVTVYHKNVCGYLSGSNATNKNSTVSSITITYTGEAGKVSGSPPTSPSFSDGRADFDVTIAASPTSGSFTISASGGSPTVNTTQILTVNMP